MHYLKEITQLHPIRRKAEQKEAFRQWAVQEITRLGYPVKVEKNGTAGHANIVVGSPDTTPLLLTAHYDTAAASLLPSVFLPRNLPLYLVYVVLMVLLLMVVSLLLTTWTTTVLGHPDLAKVLWILCYLGLLLWHTRGGIPNKNNVNDNTSGVAALMTLMASLPEQHRDKVAFILFDNEEKGMAGSKAYAKEHLQVGYTRLAVNLNCIGVGENLLVVSTKLARKHREFTYLQKHLSALNSHPVHFADSLFNACNSDWKSFKCGVNLSACRRRRLIGFYVPHLHTKKDIQADEHGIAAICQALQSCIEDLPL